MQYGNKEHTIIIDGSRCIPVDPTNSDYQKIVADGVEILPYVEHEKTYAEMRKAEYPTMEEQLDLQYWDAVNGTTVWADTIADIKAKHPKPE